MNDFLAGTAALVGGGLLHADGLSRPMAAAEKPTLIVRLEPPEITIAPGGSATVRLIAERNGYDKRIQFDVDNLPHGVIDSGARCGVRCAERSVT